MVMRDRLLAHCFASIGAAARRRLSRSIDRFNTGEIGRRFEFRDGWVRSSRLARGFFVGRPL
jgi:hypothetical protein